jgi:c-di-GMP-binding flagellar brake protein YcgR
VEPGARVKLAIAGMRELEARVEETGDTHAVLGLFREPDGLPADGRTAQGTVTFAGRRGKVEVAVNVRRHNDEPDAVHVEFASGGKTLQRRDFFRMDIVTDVVLFRENGTEVNTHTLDLSGSGALLPSSAGLHMDERVWMAIEVDDETPVRAHGKVARITKDHHRGVVFEQIGEAARERLIRYLFDRQRTTARVRNR